MVRAFQCPISNYGNAGMGIRHIYVPKAAYFTQKCECHLRQASENWLLTYISLSGPQLITSNMIDRREERQYFSINKMH